jgi:hypothetical protein
MTWTTPAAVSGGELYAVAKYNAQVKDNLLHLRQEDGRRYIAAQQFFSSNATLANQGTLPNVYNAWAMGPSSDTHLITSLEIPESWIGTGATVDLHHTQAVVGSGNSRLVLNYSFVAKDVLLTSAGTEMAQLIGPASNAHEHEVTTLGATVDPISITDRIMIIRLYRDADHAGDTDAQSFYVVGLELSV